MITHRAAPSLRNKGSFLIILGLLRLGLALLAAGPRRRYHLSYSIAPATREPSISRGMSSSPSASAALSSTYFGETKAAGTTVEITFDDDNNNGGGAPPPPSRFALAYWSIRGLGAPLTMMMCAAKVPFTLFLYDKVEKDDGSGGWTSEYLAAKREYIKKYDAPLWNLPFCVDREKEVVVCQTNAVFAYLGRACGMFGSDEKTTSRCEQLLCEIYDLRCVMTRWAYFGWQGGEEPAQVISTGKKFLDKLEAWLELEATKNNNNDDEGGDSDSDEKKKKKKKAKRTVVHLVGGKFSAPDFHLYEMLDQYGALSESNGLGDLLIDHPRLKEFRDGFAALEENQFYLNSWLHKDLPFNNFTAKFGSLPGPKTYVYGESAALATWRGKGVIRMSPSSS